MKRVLFLCTGNYYRSRFAEILFNWHAKRRGLPWRADSCGLALDSCNNGPISPYTESQLKARGIWSDENRRPPRQVAETDLAGADHIVAVKEAEHRPMVAASFPAWQERIEYWAVHDLDCALPKDALPHLEREVNQLIDRLAA